MAKKNKTYNFTGNTMTDYLAIKQGNFVNTADAFKHKALFAFPEYITALEEQDIVHFKVDQKPNGSFNLTNKTVTEQIRLTTKLTKEGNAKRDRFYQEKNGTEKQASKKENVLEQHNDEQAKKIIKEEVKSQTGTEPVLSNVPDAETRIDGLPEEELKVVANEKVRQEIEAEVKERKELHESIKQYIAPEDADMTDLPDEARRIEATHHLLTTGTRLKGSLLTDLLEEERLLIEQVGAPGRFQTRYGMEMLGGDFIPSSHNLSLEEAVKDPDTFRQNFHSFREKLNTYISNVQEDHQKVRDTIRVLQDAKEQKVSLADVLLGDDPEDIYKEQRKSTMAKRVYANIAFGGNLTQMNQALGKGIDIVAVTKAKLGETGTDANDTIRYQLANILTSTHMNDPLFLQREDYSVTKNGKDMLLHNLRNLNGNAQHPDGRSYPVYHEALATRREIKRIYSMIDDHRKDVQNQEASYIDEPSHSDGMEEYYQENKRIMDEEERKAISLDRTENVLEEEKRKPRSPITMFKNAVDQSLSVELNISEDTVELAKQARLNYKTALAQKELELAEQAKIPQPPKEKFVLEPLQTLMPEIEAKQREIDGYVIRQERIPAQKTNRFIYLEMYRQPWKKAEEYEKNSRDVPQRRRAAEYRAVIKQARRDVENSEWQVYKDFSYDVQADPKKELIRATKEAGEAYLQANEKAKPQEKEKGYRKAIKKAYKETDIKNEGLADERARYKELGQKIEVGKQELKELQAKQVEIEYHSPLKATQEAGTQDPHSVDEIIKNYGWVPEMGESPEYIKSVQDAMAVLDAKKNKESMMVQTTKIEPIPENIEYRDKWARVIDTHSTVQLPKDSIGYKAIGISGRDVILRAENILIDNLRFDIDAFTLEEKEKIVRELDEVDTRTYGVAQSTDGIMKELQSGPPKEGFVEVIFDAKSLDKRGVADLGEYIGNKLIAVDEGLQKEFGVKPGKRNVAITKDNLIELVTDRFQMIGLPENEIANQKELPSYLVKMLQSHARFIAEDPDVVSDAYLAFRDTIDDLAARGGTLDVTDDTIMRKWQEANFGIGDLTDEQKMQVQVFKETLNERSVVQRLQDSMFMDILQGAHNNFFERNNKKGASNQYDFLVNEVARIYQQKFPETPHMSVDSLVEIIRSRDLDKMFDEYRHYKGIRDMTPQQLQDTFLNQINQQLDGMPISANDSLNHLEVKEVDVESDIKIKDGVYADESIAPIDKKIVIEGGIENFDDFDRVREDTFLDPESAYIKDVLLKAPEQDKQITVYGGEDTTRYVGTKNIGMLLDVEQQRGNERLKGFANLGGNIGNVGIEVFQGSGGELLGYVPSLSRTFGIAESAAEGIRTLNMDIAAPRIKRDVPQINMSRQDGRIQYNADETFGKVSHIEKDPLFWSDMQRSGAYRIASDPSSASRNLAKFVMGKQQLAYVDVESTGLLGNTIPSKHIQPLEVHAEKIQWDTENANVMRDAESNTVIQTRSGNQTHRSMTRYVGLTDENKRFMDDIIANEDFNFSYDVKELDPVTNQYVTSRREHSVLDFLGEEELSKANEIKTRHIYEEILKQDNAGEILQTVQEKTDKLWYLRNVAKYASLGEELTPGSAEQRRFGMHAGNIPLPSIAGTLSNDVLAIDPIELTREKQFDYLSSLIGDAQEGASRLSVASKASPVKVVPMDTMIKQISNFVGKTPIIGVNVGKADIGMLLHGAQTIMDGNVSYNMQKLNMTDDAVVESKKLFINELDEVRGDLFEELKTYTGQSDNDAILSFDSDDKGTYTRVEDWFERVNKDLDQKRREGIVDGYRTVGAEQAADVIGRIQQIENIYDGMQENPFGAITKEHTDFLAAEGADISLVQNYMTTVSDNQNMTRAMQKINSREVIDQQYASTYLHPEMSSHTAGAQTAHYNIDTGNQHLAVDDVRAGIQVVEAQAKELLSDDGFKEYMSQPRKRNYRAGDIVEMTKAIDKNPRGIYQIDTLLPESGEAIFRRIDDGSDAMIQLSSIDPQDFARKMNTHFEWVGSNEKQAQPAIAEFEYDQNRRQIQRTIEHPFKFELSGLQSAGQYRENLGNLVGALDSAIAKNNAYESAMTQIDHPNTRERTDAYTVPVTERPKAPVPEFTALEKIALQNQAMLSSQQTLDILNEDITPSRQKALDESADFMSSAIGNRYRSFFNDVERLRDTGVISGARSAEMVKEWNEAIKAKAMEAGATRRVANNYNLGNLVFSAGDKDVNFDNVRIDLSSRQATKKSLDNLFNRVQGFAQGDTYEDRLNTSFKNHILPFLNKQGLVDTTSLPLKPTDTVRTAAIAENIHQTIATTNPTLAPFEQFDPLALKNFNEDPSFLSSMDNLQKQMTNEYIENLSPSQFASWKDIDRQEQALRNMDAYIPNLKVTADADMIRPVVLETLALGRHDGVIDNATTRELVEYATALKNDADLRDRFAFDSRNAIYNALTYRATSGRNITGQIPDILAERPNSDQVAAMRALNWVVDNPDMNDPRPYIQNPNYGEYVFGSGAGRDSNYNGRTMAEIDMQTLSGMMDTHVTDYTRNDHRQFFHNVATQYAEQNYPNHVGGEQAPFLRLEDGPTPSEQTSGTQYRRTEMADKNDQLKKLAAQQGTPSPYEGADHNVLTSPAEDSPQHYKEILPETRVYDAPTPPREDGLVEKWVRNRKNDVSNVVEQLDMGPGGGGRWIAGLGVAALALSMFHNAGSPIKLEDRPEGHGVAGTNGSVQDEVQFGDQGQAPQSPKPSTGGSTYVNTGEKGYIVKGKGQATSSINTRDMEKQMKNMGGNATIRMKDERSNLDRNWLQTKFDDYLNRGHVE